MSNLSAFAAAFAHHHRFKGAAFYEPLYLFIFADIYQADLPTCRNPIRDPSWSAVTKSNIEAACSGQRALSEFLCAYVGYKLPSCSNIDPCSLSPPVLMPPFRSIALGGDGYEHVRSAANVALIGVDIQNDFVLKTGALSVPDAEAAIPAINRLFAGEWAATILTADWHPADHCSFAENNPGSTVFKPFMLPNGEIQIAWPVHCVQDSPGAAFHSGLVPRGGGIDVVYKGTDKTREAYSGFAGSGRPLEARLRDSNIGAVVICGLATDYCVSATAKDAVRLGFHTTVVLGACRGVAADTTATAIAEMRAAGVVILEN